MSAPAAAVFVAIYDGKYGNEVRTFATHALAMAWMIEIVRENWSRFNEGAFPEDPVEGAETYWDRECDVGESYFSIEECKVEFSEPEPDPEPTPPHVETRDVGLAIRDFIEGKEFFTYTKGEGAEIVPDDGSEFETVDCSDPDNLIAVVTGGQMFTIRITAGTP